MRRGLSAAVVLAVVVPTSGCGGAGRDLGTIVDPGALLGFANVLDSCQLASPTVYVNDTTDTVHEGWGDGCSYTGRGTCSLRDGVSFSNRRTWTCGGGRNTHIQLPAGTYSLTQPVARALEVEGELDIDGAGAKVTIVEGGPRAASDAAIAQNLDVGIDSVFRVAKTGNLFLRKITVRYGNSPGSGGGIDAAGYLTLGSCVVADNRAAGSGGGIMGGNRPVTLTDTVLSGNIAHDDGGGLASGWTALTRSKVESNRAARGGGIANRGTLQLSDTVLTGNRTRLSGGGIYSGPFAKVSGWSVTIDANTSEGHGGGVYNDSNGQVELTRGVIRGNSAQHGNGGGVYNVYEGLELAGPVTGSSVTLIESWVVENEATPDASFRTGAGGGICNTDDGFHPVGVTYARAWASVSLRNSVVARNRALSAAGLLNEGAASQAWLETSEVSDNVAAFWAGGVANGGILNLTDSTVSGNRAKEGAGGIVNDRTATLVNATISGNSVTGGGVGGILNTFSASPGTLTLAFSTVAFNSTGIASWPGAGPFKVEGSIVANSTPGSNCPLGAVVSEGHNLDSGTSCGLATPGDLHDTDPKLGPLTVNAPGARPTHALLAGSPAVDAGGDSADGCPPHDARGVPRPRGQGCDIGAYERED